MTAFESSLSNTVSVNNRQREPEIKDTFILDKPSVFAPLKMRNHQLEPIIRRENMKLKTIADTSNAYNSVPTILPEEKLQKTTSIISPMNLVK